MMYLGDYELADTVYFFWSTNNAAGASITRSTDGTISVYKDGSDTQSTTGITGTEDVDSLTGIHRCIIDLASDGTFYSAGSDFIVVLSAATIDAQTVNAVLAHFSIENRKSSKMLKDATFGLSALETIVDDLEGRLSAARAGYLDFLNIGGNVASQASLTIVDDFLDTEIANIQARLPATLTGAGHMRSDILAVTGDGGAADGLAAMGGGYDFDGFISANPTSGGITAASIATDAIDADALAASAVTEIQTGLSTITQADIRTAVGLASANLDTQLGGIQSDTNDIQARLPAALVGGKIDASVSDITVDGVADLFLVDSGKVYADAVAGSIVKEIADNAGDGSTILAKLLKYFQLALRDDAAIATDNATELAEINANEGTGAGNYDNTDDSLEAISAAIGAGGTPDVNVISISGDTVAADNLEAMLDGTGGVDLNLEHVIIEAASGDTVSIHATGLNHGIRILSDFGIGIYATGDQAGIVGEAFGVGGAGIQAIGDTEFTGNLDGNVNGSITGNVNGNVNGNLVGDVQGDVLGNVAGNVVGNINGNVNGNVVGNVNGNVVGNLLGTLSTTERLAIADALLKRDMSAVTGEAARSPINALRFLRNRWTSIAGVLTVYEEDDVTVAWTATLISDLTANPVTGSDPA